MFTVERIIRFSECGQDEKLSITGIINHFQDTSTQQSDELGVGPAYLMPIGKAWFLASWQVGIIRRPKYGEKVLIQTWPTSFKGICGDRNFLMKDEKGEVLAYANSIWTFYDFHKGCPTRIMPEIAEKYELFPPYEMKYEPRKIKPLEGGEKKESFNIRKCHLDKNNHVNNSKYIEFAVEYLESEDMVSQVRVEYKKAAIYGDKIEPIVAKDKERMVVDLGYATIELIGENRK